MDREVELLIDDVAFGGKGVGRAEGKAVFVPFTIEGERVTARIVREKKSFAEAELVTGAWSLASRGPSRRCPYFGRCGGCSYQHMTYEHELHWKSRQVGQALQRIGKFRKPPLRPIVPSPLEYEYRNRITVHVENGVVGFFRHDAHRLIDIERCPIAPGGERRTRPRFAPGVRATAITPCARTRSSRLLANQRCRRRPPGGHDRRADFA